MAKIQKIIAREILDSRGIPTIETQLTLDTGQSVTASASSGESIGKYECLELRDGDMSRFNGLGVSKSVSYVNNLIAPKLIGVSCDRQVDVDYWLMSIDSSPQKSVIGVNTTMTLSQVVLKAYAVSENIQYYTYINSLMNKLFNFPFQIKKIPSPIFNLINGGKHGIKNLEFQEFQVIPLTSLVFSQALEVGVEIYHSVKKVLEYRNAGVSVSEEGGFTPYLLTNYDALNFLKEILVEKKMILGVDIFLGLDIAASHFYNNGKYTIKDKSAPMKSNEFIEYILELNNQFKTLVIEDAIEQEDFESWKKLNQKIGNNSYVVADDFTAGNKSRVLRAIKENLCTGILVKLNQNATLSEMMEVINLSKQAGLKTVFSHRLGETTDAFIADFAVGAQVDFVKFGAPVRGERVVKYNRLLAIENELKNVV